MTSHPDSEVAEVELVRVRVPLVSALRSAHGAESIRDLVLVRVTLVDGSTGWGECSALARPTYSAEYTAGAWAVLRDELVPDLLAGSTGNVVGHPMATHALSTARLDAGLRQRGRPLVEELGHRYGRPAKHLPVTAVVGRAPSIDALVAVVDARLADGAVLIKVKVTPHPDDLAAVTAVRAIWPDLALAVDGNGTLDHRSLSILDGLGLAYVEQPAPADDLLASAAMAKRLGSPVALDESISSVGALEVALTVSACQVVNVKPARVGGVQVAANLAQVAVDAGCAVFVGGMLESGIGRAAALAVAALPMCTLPTDLGPSNRYFNPDISTAVTTDERGWVVVPVGPGIGVLPIPGRLNQTAVDRLVLRP